MTQLQKGSRFFITDGWHKGRVYTVTGFAPDKFGVKHAIAEYGDGYSELFTESDLNAYGSALHVVTAETDEQFFDRIGDQVREMAARRLEIKNRLARQFAAKEVA